MRAHLVLTIQVDLLILLHLQVNGLWVRVQFGFIHSLAVHLHLGASFIHRFFKEIFPKEGRLVPERSKPVSILLTFNIKLTIIADAAEVQDREEGRDAG